MNQWIMCANRKPEFDGVYLVWNGRYTTTVAYLFGNWQANHFEKMNITHWMPLPNPPEVE